MGWRGTMRSIQAAARAAERDARTRQRELERRQREVDGMQELERACHEVQVYENRIDVLRSVHKQCGEDWNWKSVKSARPPSEPARDETHRQAAQSALDDYKPSIGDKLLRRTDSTLQQLALAVEDARQRDEQEYGDACAEYHQQHSEWESWQALADLILSGDPQGLVAATNKISPFEEIRDHGSHVQVHCDDCRVIEATFHACGEQIIPSQTKMLLNSGRLSVKAMPKTYFYALYQDFVCGCALRVARELVALLPVEMVIVTGVGDVLNTSSGHMEQRPILSIVVPRATLSTLNFEMLDPSDSMDNFVHRMSFRTTRGFAPVERLVRADLALD